MPRRFTKPTTKELTDYAAEIGYGGFKADAFLDYWEMRDWYIRPGIRMVSWKAAVRTWQRNDWNNKPGKPAPDQRRQQAMRDEAQIADYIKQIEAIRSWKGRTDCPYGDPEDNFRRLIDKIRDNHGPSFLTKLKDRLQKGNS